MACKDKSSDFIWKTKIFKILWLNGFPVEYMWDGGYMWIGGWGWDFLNDLGLGLKWVLKKGQKFYFVEELKNLFHQATT